MSTLFRVGGFDCRVVPDGVAGYDLDFVFPDVQKDVVVALVAGRLDDRGQLPIPYNPLLVQAGDTTVLIDAGVGAEMAAEWGEPVGMTVESLREAGVRAEDVDVLLITHAHPDHIGGLMRTEGGEWIPVFPNARHFMWKREFDFWLSAEGERTDESDSGVAKTRLLPLRDAGILELVMDEREVAEGIRLIPTPGHTPGHMSVVLSSEGSSAVVAGDAILTEWNFEHVEWIAAPELIPELVVKSRTLLLERLVRDRALLQAYHLANVGRVEVSGDAYRFLPLSG